MEFSGGGGETSRPGNGVNHFQGVFRPHILPSKFFITPDEY